ncbi:hypothetical protein C0992_010637 [Termitomyces sp. T32_za158]|nr:hypothetical protein C0992_010637 [Termitomyces sp. T32_za158]
MINESNFQGDSTCKQGPKQLVKVQTQLADAEKVTQATLKAAEKEQIFHNVIGECVIGYIHWPALSNTGFGSIPELQQGRINAHVQEHHNLHQFWISTNKGGHRLDLLCTFPYQEKIKAYKAIEEEIARIDEKKKGIQTCSVLVAELGKLQEELQGITWVTKILNKDKIEAHADAKLIKLELASNKTHFQIEEKIQNFFSLLFDALNVQATMTEENLQTVMCAAIDSSDAKEKRMIQALSSLHLTYAYSQLCYNQYFRKDMPFSLAAFKCWHRAAGAYTTSYTNWMALTFEYIFSHHELTNLLDITNNYQTFFGSADANNVFRSVTKNLCNFDWLDFSAKQVGLDLLDNDLYLLLIRASNMIKNQLDLFGHDHDDMAEEMSNQYDELYNQYTQVSYAGIDNWLARVIPQHTNDPTATTILEQLKNKCL